MIRLKQKILIITRLKLVSSMTLRLGGLLHASVIRAYFYDRAAPWRTKLVLKLPNGRASGKTNLQPLGVLTVIFGYLFCHKISEPKV